jgi:hypothetical protein
MQWSAVLTASTALVASFGSSPLWAARSNHPSRFNEAPIARMEAEAAKEAAKAGETGMANVSEKRDVEVLLLSWGAFPVEWLSDRDDIAPISEAPREAQIQMAFACAGIRAAKPTDLILIESSQADLTQSGKLKQYLVEQQGITPERIMLVYRDPAGGGAWQGWIHIRPQGVEIPVAPTPALDQWLAGLRSPALPVASPGIIQEAPIRTSQAAVMRARIEKAVKDPRPSHEKEGRVRTQISTEYLSVDGMKGGESITRASWMGFRVGSDLALFHAPIFELGFGGNVARSFLPMSESAKNATATSWLGEGYGVLRANSGVFGIPELRAGIGWMGNNRSASSNLSDAIFLPSLTGPRARIELSTRVDGVFRLGIHAGGVAAQNGYRVFDFGGSLSQRLWDNGSQSLSARVGLDAGIARGTAETAAIGVDRETWASFQVGVSASL